jgi:hypothetical protein
MGITQQPPIPTPIAKGDIIVGTATGPARLSVTGTNGVPLVSDSTTTTGLKYTSTVRTWTGTFFAGVATVSGNPGPSASTPTTKIIYGNGVYAFASERYVWYSTDLITWNYQLVSTDTIYTLAVNTAGTVWVAGGNTNLLYSASTPGGTWTARTSNMSGTSRIAKVIWVPSYSLFVLIGNANAAPWNTITTSPDGVTWTARYTYGAAATNGIELANNLSTTTVAGFQSGAATCGAYSTNGTTWTATDINDSTSYAGSIIWLPSAGRFQCAASNKRSQTPAAVATAWNTAPTTLYNTFNYAPNDSSTVPLGPNLYFPTYDAPNSRWIALSSLSQPNMYIISDTTTYLTSFTTGTINNLSHKITSAEVLPFAYGGGSSTAIQMLTYINNTFIYMYFSNTNGYYIWTAI